MPRHTLLLCALYTLAQPVASLRSRTVTIEQGPVKGYIAPEGGVFVFYGIPYATAPNGTQRFRVRLNVFLITLYVYYLHIIENIKKNSQAT